ncbi:helix-turn-helix domain-containing protein [Rummeliibacillus pycnus]|uniref:helix-turn-helix domain-containing protein n=1 Tax=Rummeliibacillus pycnus TaxID=101070 RepID=UPI000C99B7FD|nr:helix-turn-helix transcriptional regulator [Rummeliibacillus pycnus]
MDTLGNRIRTLRKQRKMTLATLAGDHITKGMLSLIENDKANPSMETLQYIAEQLQVDVSSLLEEVNIVELRKTLEKVEEIYNANTRFEDGPRLEIVNLIKPYIEELPVCYESGKLLYYYTDVLSDLKMDNWEQSLERGLAMFKEMNMMNEWMKMEILRFSIYFYEHNYEQALNVGLATEEEAKNKHYMIDPITVLDLLYYIAVTYLGINERKKGMDYLQKGLQLSKKNRLFYKIDDIYRVACYQAIMDGDDQARTYYFNKLDQYATFAEDKLSYSYMFLIQIHYYNSFARDYEKASNLLEQYAKLKIEDFTNTYFYLVEKGKNLYYLSHIDEALQELEKFKEMPPYLHHPYDLSMLAEVYSYKALCYEQKGYLSKALEEAKRGVDFIEPFIDTPYKKFINQTYELLCNKADQLT